MSDGNFVGASFDSESTAIILPLKRRDLGSFISSLLGQQQSIERTLEEVFDIDHAWLVNLHELIHQRICQQSSAHLVEFVAVVYFEGGLKRTITTIESFKAYIETKLELPVGVRTHWNYLVEFPGRPHPEKQEISFFAQINTDDNKKLKLKKEKSLIARFIFGGDDERSSIGYNIEHTERTWGDDLDVIMSREVSGVLRGMSGFDTVYNFLRWTLAAVILFGVMLYSIFSVSSDVSVRIADLMMQYNSLSGSATLENMVAKLDKITLILGVIGDRGKGAYYIFMPIFAPVLALIFLRFTNKPLSSFVVLSALSKQHKINRLASEKRSNFTVILSYLFTIVAGIISGYGYSFLTAT